MFFILAQSRNGGKTWEDQFHQQFETGKEAQAEAKRFNDSSKRWGNNQNRWRVRQVVDTDGDNFVTREKAKNHKFIDWSKIEGKVWKSCNPYWQLAHIDPTNSRHARFFRELPHAITGRYTSMLLTRFFSSHVGLEDEQFMDYVTELGFYEGQAEFEILRDPDEIEEAYANGPRSCMNDPEDYDLSCNNYNPVRIYGSPDLGLAVLKRGTDVIARTVVFPERKIYARIYGHAKALKAELDKLGYRHTVAATPWRGARLLAIYDQDEGAYVCPYLDMSDTVSLSRDKKYLRISGSNGRFDARCCAGFCD